MTSELSTAGAADPELARNVHKWWKDAAEKRGINLGGFDSTAPLAERIAIAQRLGLMIATVYSRFSSKRQHSTEDQVRECVIWAAQNGFYVPPEFVSVDESIKGKRIRRDGLSRMKQILQSQQVSALLVFKVSRLFRQPFQGYQLVQQEVVEEGLRAVSVSQGIDTNDKKGWKIQLQVHGIMDDLLLDAIADHVRAGQTGNFLKCWTTGAISVGYRPKVLPDAPLTNRGLPRTTPEVDPVVAELIRKHARLLLGGMSLKRGWRQWLTDGGPCDPRSTTGYMSYKSYRRLWRNARLVGHWEYGRMRNSFSTKRDYTLQIQQPDSNVSVMQCEELRILDDETFHALQSMLNNFRRGPHGPRKQRPVQLWDLTTDLFYCAHCSTPDLPVRFHQAGAHGSAMQCKNRDLCKCTTAVRRDEAVQALCQELAKLIARDSALVEEVICRSRELDTHGYDDLRKEISMTEKQIQTLTHRINDLYELSGKGAESDRQEVLARIQSAQTQRADANCRLIHQKRTLEGATASLTPDEVRSHLSDMSALLENAAAGLLGSEAVHTALAVFRGLTGGRIMVHVEPRKGRKRVNVRGVFQSHLIQVVQGRAGMHGHTANESAEISVWLRQPPRLDQLADRVHQLIDQDGLSYREAAHRLRQEGHNVNSGNTWYIRRRYYEMQGQPVPKKQHKGRPKA